MKMISDIAELKKGDTIIVKDYACFESLGYRKVFGEVFSIDLGNPNFIIKCKETDAFENVSIENGKIFLIN
ncbi:MAG: hypothetical protein PHY93_19515 [Bacteriovorax sp.]|nr:hypothetical protein [Bacteriovorax sp.]